MSVLVLIYILKYSNFFVTFLILFCYFYALVIELVLSRFIKI